MPLVGVCAPFILSEITKLIKNNMSKKFNYQEQHAVIVKCSSEEHQKKVFNKLKKMGFENLKVVSV
jgi:endonuclease III-like uncharacterized protein